MEFFKRSLSVFVLVAAAAMALSCASQQPPLPSIELSAEVAREMRGHKGYWIEVQIPQRRLVLAKADHVIKIFPVAVGLPKYPTPAGRRKISAVVWNPWWTPPKESDWVDDPTPVPPRSKDNPLGEIKMPLGNAYLIHGTKAVDSIGRWASHGCIRMLYEDIFGLVQLLMMHYSKSNAVDMMEKANQAPTQEFTTALTRDVPVILTYETVKIRDGYVTIYPDIYGKYDEPVDHIAAIVRPHLNADPDLKRIQMLLKTFKGKTIHVALKSLEE